MLNSVPESANLNLGCGNPQAIAALREGETVLDLGSGAGFDSFLAARQVGNLGCVMGVDMTFEMVKKAYENAAKGSYPQVVFQVAAIEHLPVPSASVDVIISNCVINLSPDKPQVFREAYRVLKAGGRLAISDVVATAEIPQEIRDDLELYSSCIAGAIETRLLKQMLSEIGFKEIEILAHDQSHEIIHNWSPGDKFEDLVQSASIKARK
jgi:ubiquinone/menaquinone biosynthesis C-methylase UbiE